MSDPRSNPNDWAQSYDSRVLPRQVPPSGVPSLYGGFSALADSMAVSTATTTTITTAAATTTTPSTNSYLNAQGRIGKPAKRRTRASRKGPTTLFNTDTTNFRAMVQQFTGAPTPPMSSASHSVTPLINFGYMGHRTYHGLMVPPPNQLQLQPQTLVNMQGGGEASLNLPLGNNIRPSASLDVSHTLLETLSSSSYGQSSSDNNGTNGLHFIREERFRNQY